MKGKYRGDLTIAKDILTAGLEPCLITAMSGRVRLNFAALRMRLMKLEALGFIDHRDNGAWQTTDRGRKMLAELERVHVAMGGEE